ncbi:Titin [Chionoecetes opilio]|uniref:Titin n=1 Tax=Chionoecetes opilio TaxID=41210 RepID=A0A8J4YQB2_CHIOP|nr:Titin [Chionoecetes opilio]
MHVRHSPQGAAGGAPDKPKKLQVIPVTSSSIVVLWGKPSADDEVDHYFVYMENEDREDTTDVRYFVWEGLTACKNYTVGVRAVSAQGDVSEPALGEAVTEIEAPPAPQNLHVVSFTSTSIMLTCDNPDTLCDIDRISITWASQQSVRREVQAHSNILTISPLMPNTTYNITIAASNCAGVGPVASITQTTASDSLPVMPRMINSIFSQPAAHHRISSPKESAPLPSRTPSDERRRGW